MSDRSHLKYECPLMLFDDYLDDKFTKEEFVAGMHAMGFNNEEIARFVRDEVETAKRIWAVIDEKGGIEPALSHFAAHARRSQFKVVE
jgi:hypothetical protein